MDVERDFLGVGAPVLVVEAVGVFAVFSRVKGVVAIGYAAFVDLVAARRSFNLSCPISPRTAPIDRAQSTTAGQRTQKSISRFPLPPNSRSPTWKVTVILSPLCSCSWKHSRWWAFIWMLCAVAKDSRLLAAARMAKDGNSMFAVVVVLLCRARGWTWGIAKYTRRCQLARNVRARNTSVALVSCIPPSQLCPDLFFLTTISTHSWRIEIIS